MPAVLVAFDYEDGEKNLEPSQGWTTANCMRDDFGLSWVVGLVWVHEGWWGGNFLCTTLPEVTLGSIGLACFRAARCRGSRPGVTASLQI